MASDLRIRVANFTTTITFAKTDSEVANVLRLFVQDWAAPPAAGLTQTQLNQYYLDQAAARIVEMVRQEARRVRVRQLLAEQASVEETATNETAI